MEDTALTQQILRMLSDGAKADEVEQQLLQQGHDQYFLKQVIGETVKLRAARARTQSLAFILAGALVCFLSFLLTITSTFSATSFPIVLYGLTSIGIILVFAGFMKIF